MSDVTAVVLCGGRSSRFGADKTRAPFSGTTVLDHLLDALPADWPIIAVGEQRRTARIVTWTRESPAFAGPLAGLAAALDAVASPTIVVIAGDMPYAGRAAQALVDELARGQTDAVLATDPSGRRQPLLAAYRTDAVRAALPQPTTEVPMMRLLDALTVSELAMDADATADIDEPADLDRLDQSGSSPTK
ncbi:molybdenum cofactor guanylyltransferase [Luteipulveratus mongoliensis]|uniref:MobA-like NTP transferase domain-containing protein n=1 Tax=Luteipulveratus mongoliensis TaxID=571913 RepID=A0A0K1JF40_9MICO|nr:NTP transferase domain-containing protein [Luteipulveratus mongoliensis]AKU15342.1 hypothetical protein VV02_04800 [Luteipulveratus mongoliensis]